MGRLTCARAHVTRARCVTHPISAADGLILCLAECCLPCRCGNIRCCHRRVRRGQPARAAPAAAAVLPRVKVFFGATAGDSVDHIAVAASDS